jgi:hypothetical protein
MRATWIGIGAALFCGGGVGLLLILIAGFAAGGKGDAREVPAWWTPRPDVRYSDAPSSSRGGSATALLAVAEMAALTADVAGRSVEITVSPTAPGSWGGAAFPGQPHIWIGQDAYQSARRGGVGLVTMLHEIGHTTGIIEEHPADCFALARLRPVLRQYWHLSARQAESRYQDALAWSRSMSSDYGCLA